MKKPLLFCTFIVNVLIMNAQADWCGTKMDDSFLNNVTVTAEQNVTMAYFDDKPPLVLKVHFYDVRPDQFAQQHPFLTETEALNAVAELNRNYNAFKIFFKFDGIDSFLSDEFYEIDANPDLNPNERDWFKQFINQNGYYIAGAVNIYSVQDISNNIAAYYSSMGNGVFATIVSRYTYIDNPGQPYILSHEVGHNFNLKHTFQCNQLNASSPPVCENVTREPFLPDGVTPNPDYNATTEGDRIIDTFATPLYYNYGGTNCVYDDNLVDSTGTPYALHPPQAKNFMGYTHPCQQEFTAGQVAHMRWYINWIDNYPGITVIIKQPVSILYEPYKGEYYLAGPLPVDTDGRPNPPLFQYGFDYVFYDTTQAAVYNQPSIYSDTSFWYGSVVQSFDTFHTTPIEHINHTAFKILQVDPHFPRMCYNNFNRAPTGGTVIKFLDGVPNTNVTISPKDSLQINSPTFFPDLEPGLYNIQKSYNDGTSEENLIMKENN